MNDTTLLHKRILIPADFKIDLDEPMAAAGLKPQQIQEIKQSALTMANLELLTLVFKHLDESAKDRIRQLINRHDGSTEEIANLVSREYDSVRVDPMLTFGQLAELAGTLSLQKLLESLEKNMPPSAFNIIQTYFKSRLIELSQIVKGQLS